MEIIKKYKKKCTKFEVNLCFLGNDLEFGWVLKNLHRSLITISVNMIVPKILCKPIKPIFRGENSILCKLMPVATCQNNKMAIKQ